MDKQPTQGEAVVRVLRANGNKLVTYKELMDASGIDTRQRLHFVVKDLVRRKNLPIEMSKGNGYIYEQETPSG
jgi:hypothetical protein